MINATNQKDLLFIIPCSGDKDENGEHPPWNEVRSDNSKNRFYFLDPYRLKLIHFFSHLSQQQAKAHYLNRYKYREKKVLRAWRTNLNIHKYNTKLAMTRYCGLLYKEFDQSILHNICIGQIDNLLILSALMGIIQPTDCIPHYELLMGDREEKYVISEYWTRVFSLTRKLLMNFLSKYKIIYCFLPQTTGYLKSLSIVLQSLNSYKIRPLAIGQRNILVNWGKVINEVLLTGAYLNNDIVTICKKYDCQIDKL